jgi:molecular chaperone GrpE
MNDPTDPSDTDPANGDTDKTHESPDIIEESLEQAQARADQARDQMLRAHADIENSRRRYEREVQNASRYGVETLVAELLPVKDSLQEALKAAAVDDLDAAAALGKIIEGTRLTLDILDKALAKSGLSEVHPQGEPFNPDLHQALSRSTRRTDRLPAARPAGAPGDGGGFKVSA